MYNRDIYALDQKKASQAREAKERKVQKICMVVAVATMIVACALRGIEQLSPEFILCTIVGGMVFGILSSPILGKALSSTSKTGL